MTLEDQGFEDSEPDEPLSGPAAWPFGKLVAVLWAVIMGAIIGNLFVVSAAWTAFGHGALPVGLLLLWAFPLSLILALWMARWVRQMVDEA